MSPLAATADEQLMRAYATGQAAAFETLYDRHSARVWRYILRSTGDAAAADDLAQEVWFSVAREAGRYAPRASAPDLPLARFSTWLFTLARHRVVEPHPHGVEAERELVRHIEVVVDRYKGRIATWDVVNEVIRWEPSPRQPWRDSASAAVRPTAPAPRTRMS